MKKIGLVLAVAALGFTANAQKNITKIGSSSGFVSTMYNLSQERALNDKMSIQASLRYRPSISIPQSLIGDIEYDGNDYNPFINPVFSGSGASVELRIYGKSKEVLKGFYWGPYLNLTAHKLSSEKDYIEFTDDNNITYFGDVQQILRVTNYGGGLQIGTQKVWDGGFTLDWTILGIGFNNYIFSGEYTATNTSGNFDARQYEDDINEAKLDLEKYADISFEIEKESVKIIGNTLRPHLKMSLSIGFAYKKGESFDKSSF